MKYDNFLYKRNKPNNNVQYWVCKQQNCNVRVHSSLNDPSLLFAAPRQHAHPADADEIDYITTMNAAIARVQEDVIHPVPGLYENIVDELERQNAFLGANPAPDFRTLRSTLYRSRNLIIPDIPHHINHVDFTAVDQRWSNNARGDRFLIRVSLILLFLRF